MTAQSLRCTVGDFGLVFEGGGYRAAYTAACANMLLRHELHFPYVCGISAGSTLTVNYVSRDMPRVRDTFMGSVGLRPVGGVGSFVRGNGYFNADYIYGDLVHEIAPFDWETFQESPAEIGVRAVRADDGASISFSKKDMPNFERLISIVRASSTLPGIMHPDPIDGVTYFDGGLGIDGGLPHRMALEAGYERFVLVATRVKGYRKKQPTSFMQKFNQRVAGDNPVLYEALMTRWQKYNEATEELEHMEKSGQALVIRPHTMPISSGTLDREKLAHAYRTGFQQYEHELPRVLEFLGMA